MTVVDHDEPFTHKREAQNWLAALSHRLTVRIALLIGVIVFVATVGIDSSQHQASAADMGITRVSASPALSTPKASPPKSAPHQAVSGETNSAATYLEFNAETAARLSRSDLTSASLTRSRLTSSHLFTHRIR